MNLYYKTFLLASLRKEDLGPKYQPPTGTPKANSFKKP